MTAEKSGEPVKVLVYSDDRNTRAQMRNALGTTVASDLPPLEVIECATAPAVLNNADTGSLDLIILDGEAVPVGGMGLCRSLKDEVPNCPPVLMVVGRRDDAWLATWSRAEAVVSHPIDPVRLPREVATLLRARLSGTPVAL